MLSVTVYNDQGTVRVTQDTVQCELLLISNRPEWEFIELFLVWLLSSWGSVEDCEGADIRHPNRFFIFIFYLCGCRRNTMICFMLKYIHVSVFDSKRDGHGVQYCFASQLRNPKNDVAKPMLRIMLFTLMRTRILPFTQMRLRIRLPIWSGSGSLTLQGFRLTL